ncbi:nuclear transport factor 2 family protein [Rhodopseudomonas palustris]|jgi:steroid delta-isomerase|uniref:nuclear transport factor 2 family protein n=1 Tax=Rhodopseudomonas palustris TaxID=1076 RepID=UPI000642187C|nr:nuclear transport factor 2 family protein [Rhodopseudomonas palustris]
MTRLSRSDLEHHATTWIEAWNRHDVSAVIEPFAADAVFVSPRAATVTGDATVQGRDALYAYWIKALDAVPDLVFKFESAVCDEAAQTVLVHYVSHAGGRTLRACELMRFENGRQVYGEAFYGADVSQVPA